MKLFSARDFEKWAGDHRWLLSLYAQVHLWKADVWQTNSQEPFQQETSRTEVDHPMLAHVMSSKIRSRELEQNDRHAVALDLDVPAALIPSSTPGHSHLIINKALPWEDYRELLEVLEKVGILQPGYVANSIKRKATFLRLPWIRKGVEEMSRQEAVESHLEGEHTMWAPDPGPVF